MVPRFVISLVLAVVPAVAAQPARSAPFACDYPVRKGDTAASLKARFGKLARREMLPGPEGQDFPGLVLWPDDGARRMEVLFDDAKMTRYSGVRIRGPRSAWRSAGVGIGATPAQVRAANNSRFTINGFEWDYGGYADLGAGKLTHLPGGCRLTLRFNPRDSARIPRALSGDGVHIASDDPRLKASGARVSEITLLLDTGK